MAVVSKTADFHFIIQKRPLRRPPNIRSVTTMPNTPHTMLDQVGRNATQHDAASWGEIVTYVATGLFIVYGMPWIITWAAQWVRV